MQILQIQNDRHIQTVVMEQECKKHASLKGEPCYYIPSTMIHGVVYFGACNTRARKAGMVGKIDPSSLSRIAKKGARRV